MNTLVIDKTKWKGRVVNFEWELFDVLWVKHEEKYSERRNMQLNYFERLIKSVNIIFD